MTTLVYKWRPMAMSRLLWQIFAVVLAVAVLIASAKIQVPMHPVPMTFQTLAVFAIGGVMGWRLALLSLASYMLLGSVGLPVFAGNPAITGGFLYGFLFAALFMGWLAENGKLGNWQRNALAMVIATAIIYAFGVAWLQDLVGLGHAIVVGVLPFLWGDLFKIALATGFVALWHKR